MKKAIFLVACLGLSAAIAVADELDAVVGQALFERQWVAAPASTDASDGLGPLFNAKSCAACHRNGGGAVVSQSGVVKGFVLRLTGGDGKAHPDLGRQLQDQAIAGHGAEGRVAWVKGTIATHFATTPAVKPQMELRLAPSLRVTKAIEAADAKAIAELADPFDKNGDGVSGRMRKLGDGQLGRFGIKSSHATVDAQVSDAFAFDLGLSSPANPLAWGDCTVRQTQCRLAPHGQSKAMRGQELSSEMIALVSSYLRALQPARKPMDETGENLFASVGCASCHVPTLPTSEGQQMRIFSDLLLHDLGAARQGVVVEDDVSPSEWRTSPLIDLAPGDAKRLYMHDGGARSIAEAIDLHGGEAQTARRRYLSLSEKDRNALIRYLEAL
jgi:CxxC motif-containing protein (DUF1111 family)